MKKGYWFSDLDPSTIVQKMMAGRQSWSNQQTNPICQSWTRNAIAYYSTILEAQDWQSALGFTGDQGELIKMVIPTSRSLVRQIVTLTTKERLSFTAIAESRGADVTEDMRIANGLMKEIIKDCHLDKLRELAAEQACIWGMGFLKPGWRTDMGQPYMANPVEMADGTTSQQTEYDGKIDIETPSVFDLQWDARISSWYKLNWVECRTIKNRWDMVASFPELEEAILQIPPMSSSNMMFVGQGGTNMQEQDDLIYVYELYHKPSSAMPEGRMMMYSDEKTVFHDGPNEYGCIPVISIIPEPIHTMGFGYAILSNFLPAQEMFDTCASAIATNNANLAVQTVLCPRNADINVEQIQGMNYAFYTPQNADSGGKPEALQLTQSAPETFKFADFLDKYMTAVSGLNSTIRGTPPAGLTSGTAIATMSANALEFLNSLSKALDLALEQTMYNALKFYKKFAIVPREITLEGKNNKSSSKTFTGKNLESVKNVTIHRSNPLMATLAGRADIADKLLQTGLIKDLQQYFSVIEGAPKDQLYKVELSENDLMESENDALLEGQEVRALSTDDHPQHIRQHAQLLNSPELRMDDAKIQPILNHILEHYQLAQSTDPLLMSMVRTGKMPEGGMMQPPPMAAPSGGAGMPEQMPEPQTAGLAEDQVDRGVMQ